MNNPNASQVRLSKQVPSILVWIALLLLVWGASRAVAASDSVLAAALAGIPFGVCGGYLVAKAEVGEAIFVLPKRSWWAFVIIIAALSAIKPASSSFLLLATMSGSMLLSYLLGFALFYRRLTKPDE